MAIKKSERYSSFGASCDELRGGMDAVRPDGWRAVQAKKNVIKAALYGILQNVEEVERVFLIIRQQTEYRCPRRCN